MQTWTSFVPYEPVFATANVAQPNCKDTTEVGKLLILLFGLPFLEPSMVHRGFRDYFIPTAPTEKKVKKLLKYLEKRYCSSTATYPSPPQCGQKRLLQWVVRQTSARHFVHKFNAQFYPPHPNISVFLTMSWKRLSLIHIWRCRRSTLCRSRWSPYH